MAKCKRAVVTLEATTGLPVDAYQNVLHFAPDDSNANIVSAVQDFFIGDVSGTVTPIGAFLGTSVSRASLAHKIEVYSVPDSPGPVGSPIFTGFFTMPSAGTATMLPTEVAVCMSMQADVTGVPVEEGDTRPLSRHRGRIYLGPLTIDAAASGQPYPRPDSDFVDSIVAAAEEYLSSSSVHVGVFSPTDWAWRVLAGGWIDDEFDTQRRRGRKPTARTSFGT